MPLRFKSRILDHLAHRNYLPIYVHDVARQLRVGELDGAAFDEAVRQLSEEGLLNIGKDEKLRLPQLPEEVEGVIKLTPRGMGFLKTDIDYREGDLFIPAGETKDAVSGDRVRVRVVRRGDRTNYSAGPAPSVSRDNTFGRVLEVLVRGQSRFAGELVQRGREWIVEPDGRTIREPIVIRDPHAKNAKAGDKVVIDIITWPESGMLAEGVIVEVLGEAGRPDVETKATIATYMIREVFPPEALDQAREAAVSFDNAVRAAMAANDSSMPPGLNWDLYLGPAPEIAYHPAYHPFAWRGWLDFGVGSLGDMGAHLIDQPFTSLGLTYPTSIAASSTPWGGGAQNPATYPMATMVQYDFPKVGKRDALKLYWYDGGLMPPRPEMLPDEVPMNNPGSDGGGGVFVGEKGIMFYETYGNKPRIFPEAIAKKAEQVPVTVPRITVSHEQNWIQASKGEAQSSSPFSQASPLTETMLLGMAALRAGQGRKVNYDSERMAFTNAPDANQYLTRVYRKGWEL